MFACVCVLESDWCLDSHISTLQGTEINSLTTHFQAFISKEFDIIADTLQVFSVENAASVVLVTYHYCLLERMSGLVLLKSEGEALYTCAHACSMVSHTYSV